MSVFALLIPLILNQGAWAKDISPEKLYRNAVALYIDETKDYLASIDESQELIKAWRAKILQAKFVEKMTVVEKALSDSNNQVIKQIESYVKKHGLDSLDDTLLMRMAQLYYDRAIFDFNEKMSEYEKQISQFQSGKIKTAPVPPTPNFKKTMFYAIELLKKFKSSPLSDWAHYLLGYCLFDEGNGEKASQMYARMIKAHPFSALIPEVRWRLAEYLFDMERYNEAEVQYKALIEDKGAFAKKATYKLGATYYVQGKLQEAGRIFQALMEESYATLGSRDPEVATIYDESIDYLAHLRAKNTHLVFDEDTDGLITDRLAMAYSRIQSEEQARKTYLEYVSRKQLSKFSPRFMNSVISSYEGEGKDDQAQNVRARLVSALGPQSVYWSRHKNDVDATVEASDLYEQHLLASAAYFAQKAKEGKKKSDYDQAVLYYRKFLSENPFSPLRVQARFDLAELQFESQRYAEASITYLEVASDPDSYELGPEAAYGHVMSEVKVLNFPLQDTSLRSPRDGQGKLLPPTPLSAQELKFIKAAQYFVGRVNSGVKRQKILYRTAVVFYNHNQFEKARKALELVLKDSVNSTITKSAIQLIATTYDVENNWEKFSEANERALRYTGQTDPDDLLALENLEGGLYAEVGEQNQAFLYDKRGRALEAIQAYDKLLQGATKAKDIERFLYRTGVNYRRAHDYNESQRTFDRLITEYPRSGYSVYARFFKAANMASNLQFEEAATAYEKFAEDYQKSPLAKHALFGAASIQKGLGKLDRAANNLLKFGRLTEDDEAIFSAAKLYGQVSRFSEAAKIYENYVNGARGKQFVIRALFERALLGDSVDAPKARVKQSLADCAAIETISKKYSLGQTASNDNGVKGCQFVSTWPLRNTLLNYAKKPATANLEREKAAILKVWGKLQARYEELAKQGVTNWNARGLIDQGELFSQLSVKFKDADEGLSKSYALNAKEAYSKAIEISKTLNQGLMFRRVANLGLKALEKTESPFVDPHLIFSSYEASPKQIRPQVPSDSPLRPYFDQQEWDKVISTGLSQPKSPETSLVLARAYAERGSWKKAGETLEKCVADFKDAHCGAANLMIGFGSSNLKKFVAKAWNANKNDPYLMMAVGYYFLQNREPEKAVPLAQRLVTQDKSRTDGYVLAAHAYSDLEKWEFAQIALREATYDYSADEGLETLRGYMALRRNYLDEAGAIVEDIRELETSSPALSAFVANYLFYSGKTQEAFDYLKAGTWSESEIKQIKTAEFALALMAADKARLEKSLPTLTKVSSEIGRASFYLGIYYRDILGDVDKAAEKFRQAKEQGLAMGLSLDDKTQKRKPAQGNSEEGT